MLIVLEYFQKLGKLFKLSFFTLAFILTSSQQGMAQDIHFSQYLSAPFNLNPALTGDFKGDYRLIGNYRNQWRSITVPYKTYGIAGDMTNVAGVRNLSGGLSIYNDQAGDSRMNTLIVQLSGSYGYALTSDSAHSIYFGLMPSIHRQEFDYSELNFDNQYDNQKGVHDPNIPSGELQDQTAVSYFNLATGIRYNYAIAPRHNVELGFSIYNMLGTNRYFLVDETSDMRRYNLHANYQVKVWDKIDLLPGMLFNSQGKNRNLVLGSSARYLFNGYTAFHAGFWYRNQDAMFTTFGITYQSLYMGFSYDINTSELNDASNGQGAYELSLIYVFRKFKPNKGKYLSCPNYL